MKSKKANKEQYTEEPVEQVDGGTPHQDHAEYTEQRDSDPNDTSSIETNIGASKKKDSRLVRFLIALCAVVCLGYVVWAMVFFSRPRYYGEIPTCKHLYISFANNESNINLNEEDVIRELKQMNQYPIGKRIDQISVLKIKKQIEQIGLFKDAEVYLTSNNDLYIHLDRNNPLFAAQINGKSYYVGVNRSLMKASTEYPVPLSIFVSGHLDSTMAVTKIYDLVEILLSDHQWKDLFSQIYVKDDGDIVLLSRISDTEVILGKSSNWSEKLDNLKIFVDQVISKSGWDQFNTINLKFEGQIVTQPNIRQK
ncbi:cell division protein FtsQ/DivIB [Falsiporphyromonas endometrii]|uniref:Cell division protein FtsQ/DivIB n=1 Tax=Falsiporphyromonas endometrii TaxID=1387297 RepID=A0ABV9K5K9_9PORP